MGWDVVPCDKPVSPRRRASATGSISDVDSMAAWGISMRVMREPARDSAKAASLDLRGRANREIGL